MKRVRLDELLVARGLGDPETAAHFLADGLSDLPDPFLMRGMRPAVERLAQLLVRSCRRMPFPGDPCRVGSIRGTLQVPWHPQNGCRALKA